MGDQQVFPRLAAILGRVSGCLATPPTAAAFFVGKPDFPQALPAVVL
jgi:hypothetical protein